MRKRNLWSCAFGWLVAAPIAVLAVATAHATTVVAVEETIHFVHKFQRYHAAHGDVQLAIRETLETTGVALLFTTLVLASGFSVMGFAYMVNLQWFALLSSVGAITAFIADVILAPALFSLATVDRVRMAGGELQSG